jgi:prephenate dehydrogenase
MAIKSGAADEVFDTPQGAVRGADLAVFCTPVLSVPELVETCFSAFEKDCIVTDVGSTKAEIVHRMVALTRSRGIRFVGSHPMTGGEKTGIESARADLYEGTVTAITPAPDTDPGAVNVIADLWRRVGARVISLDPAEHDRIVARTSHLPHLIAALLVGSAGRDVTPKLKALIGQGFRDATRIAAGSPEMWHDIVKTNQSALVAELHEYDLALRELIRLIEGNQFDAVKDLLERLRLQRAVLLV